MKIYLAGGCFWGVEAFISRIPGVIKTTVGYLNGETTNPSYEEVCNGSGHTEAVEVEYLPSLISLENLLTYFFYAIDPTSLNKQGNDVGIQYRSGIYYVDDKTKSVGEKFLAAKAKDYKEPMVVELKPVDNFYPAETYHQAYLNKNPMGYCHINVSKLLKKVFDHILANLPPLAYEVMADKATEAPGSSEYIDNFAPGLYFDIISGEPLFSSQAKFPCSCGWPSFNEALKDAVYYKEDYSHGMERVEVLSASSQGHLGHVFPNEYPEYGAKRYCINGICLKFVPQDELEEANFQLNKDR